MRRFPPRLRCLCAILLICLGGCGILLAPSVGLFGGRGVQSYTLSEAQEHEWGTAISTKEFELPFVHNQRGLLFMNVFLAGSLGAIFGGVHWLATVRRSLGKR